MQQVERRRDEQLSLVEAGQCRRDRERYWARPVDHAADHRALELLLSHLNPAQRETFENNGWFVVEGGKSKKKYRVHTDLGVIANVEVLEGERVSHRLCAHLLTEMPLGDQFLAQKLMLELAEDHFLSKANRHPAYR